MCESQNENADREIGTYAVELKVYRRIVKHLGLMGISAKQLIKDNLLNEINFPILGFLVISTISAHKFLWCEASNFREYGDSLYETSCVTVACANFIVSIWKMPNTFKFIENLEIFISKRLKNSASRNIYEEIVKTVEKGSTLLFRSIMYVTVPSIFFPKGIASYFNHYVNGLGNDAFELPYPMWIPFDWRDPRNYIAAFCFQYLHSACVAHIFACNVSFITATCWMLISLTEDIRKGVQSFNNNVRCGASRLRILYDFNEMLGLQSDAIQLARDFSDAFTFIIGNLCFWCFSTLCGTVLLVQMEGSGDSWDLFTLLSLFGQIFWSFAFVFLFCEFGERVSNGFEGLNEALNKLDWYLIPTEIQRMLPTAMIIFQQPTIIPIMGKIACSRYVFDKIVNRAFSCSMIILQMKN